MIEEDVVLTKQLYGNLVENSIHWDHIITQANEFEDYVEKYGSCFCHEFFDNRYVSDFKKTLFIPLLATRFRDDLEFLEEYISTNRFIGEETDLTIDVLANLGVQLSDKTTRLITYTPSYENNLDVQKYFVVENVSKFKKFMSPTALDFLFKNFSSLKEYAGMQLDNLTEEQYAMIDANSSVDNSDRLRGVSLDFNKGTSICGYTFSTYKNIFRNVLEDKKYEPFVLLQKDNIVFGVLKFLEHAYCLHFNNILNENNQFVAYKGLVSYPHLNTNFLIDIHKNLSKEKTVVLDIETDLVFTPVLQITESQIYQNNYFSSSNIDSNISSFMQALSSKQEKRIVSYGIEEQALTKPKTGEVRLMPSDWYLV